jgi:hypothetical protein
LFYDTILPRAFSNLIFRQKIGISFHPLWGLCAGGCPADGNRPAAAGVAVGPPRASLQAGAPAGRRRAFLRKVVWPKAAKHKGRAAARFSSQGGVAEGCKA